MIKEAIKVGLKVGLMSITRRHMIAASTAVIPAPVGPPFSALTGANADPILAAIEAHRRVYAELLALIDWQTAADQALQQAGAATRRMLQAQLDALCQAEGPLGRTESIAASGIAHTVPATLPGVLATLRYVRTLFERDGYALFEDGGYRALLYSTERALDRALAA